MSGLHGSWSIGSFAGAGIGALAVGAGITLTPQLLVLGSLALLAAGLLTTRMLPDAAARPSTAGQPHDAEHPAPRAASRWSGGMLLLGAIAFASMLCEGAAANWSSVYLSGPLHGRGAVPGLGYAAFALAMLIVRLFGNRLLSRYRPDRLLPALALVATAGFAAALLIARPAAALAGFACLGIGLASVVPAAFSAAGRIPGLHPGTAVATASACGWAGYVCGPPLIGRLAALASLPVALGLLPVLTAFIVIGTATVRALKPAGPSGRVGGRRRALHVGEYGQGPSAVPVPQARRAQPPRGRAARPGHGPAHGVLPPALERRPAGLPRIHERRKGPWPTGTPNGTSPCCASSKPKPGSCWRAWTSPIPSSRPGCRRSPAEQMTGEARVAGRPDPFPMLFRARGESPGLPPARAGQAACGDKRPAARSCRDRRLLRRR
jgi:hypothetical protein